MHPKIDKAVEELIKKLRQDKDYVLDRDGCLLFANYIEYLKKKESN